MSSGTEDTKLQFHEARLAESLAIFQSTMTMLSIFSGFVFASLLQLLSGTDPLSPSREVVVRLLLVALVMLLVAMFSFHHSAHAVFRYWQVFIPKSRFIRIGATGLLLGVAFMLFGLAYLLRTQHLGLEAVCLSIFSVCLVAYLGQSRRLHNSDARYLVDVD